VTDLKLMGEKARDASYALGAMLAPEKNMALKIAAEALLKNKESIILANKTDIDNAIGDGIKGALIDRLTLDEKRIEGMADGLLQVAALPDPVGELTAENLYFTAGGRPIIKGISFRMPAGQSLAIIGPSAAGKSTLCKLLLNIWQPTNGKVRIDRADISSWDSEKLGPFLGYLPQDVELFAGTVAENIARLGDVDSAKVIKAARLAGVHEMILALPKGYDTQIGEAGAALSGGQRQRIGLARALYGDPCLIVLDEPNSNLDEEGEASLAQAVLNLKEQHASVILVTHKPHILNIVDNIMLLKDGQIVMCGTRKDVLDKLAQMRRQHEEAAKARMAQEKLAKQQAELEDESHA